MIYTLETKLNLAAKETSLLEEDLKLYSKAFRQGFLLYSKTQSEKELYDYFRGQNLTSLQTNSLIHHIKGTHKAAKESQSYRLKELGKKIKLREKAISKVQKKITAKKKKLSSLKRYEFLALQKEIQADSHYRDRKQQALDIAIKKSLDIESQIAAGKVSVCFGGRKLMKQGRLLDKESPEYADWKETWNLARNGERFAVGNKNKPNGNSEIQYDVSNGQVRIRLSESIVQRRLKSRKETNASIIQCRFLTVGCKSFPYLEKIAKKQKTTVAELLKGKPVTALLKRRANGFYLYLSVDIESNAKPAIGLNTMGLDYNADGIGYNVVKPDGNRLTGGNGFIPIEKTDNAGENELRLSNALESVLKIAKEKNCRSLAIENLDFFDKKNHMRSGLTENNKFYNKTLSTLSYIQYQDFVIRKAERYGFKVSLVNPCFSSIAGFVKFAYHTNQSADIGAAQAIARQALYGELYSKKTDLPHVVRHKLKKELVNPLQHSYRQNQRKKSENAAIDTWGKLKRAVGWRSQWRKNYSLLLNTVVSGAKGESQSAKARLSVGERQEDSSTLPSKKDVEFNIQQLF